MTALVSQRPPMGLISVAGQSTDPFATIMEYHANYYRAADGIGAEPYSGPLRARAIHKYFSRFDSLDRRSKILSILETNELFRLFVRTF